MEERAIHRGRVLIVDDQPPNVLLLELILRQAGYADLRSTTDPHAVLSLVAEFQPDILLLDLNMPGLTGFQVMDQLKGIVGNETYLPILVLTADMSVPTKQRALGGGAKDFLTKPFDVPEVLQRIRNLLETRFLHLQLQDQNQVLEFKVRERTRDLEGARIEILQRLSLAAEFRDDDTGQHTQRVGRVSALLAQALGLPNDLVQLVRLAAPLHDVGKIGIADSILLKAGELAPDEFRVMTTHTSIGGKILSGSQSPLLQLAEQIALTHHECWDGSGYPLGRRGEAISLAGRIVSVADVFDALTHRRPYKQAWPVEEAAAEIERLGGRKFDPRVVEKFQQVLRQGVLSQEAADTSQGGREIFLTSPIYSQGDPTMNIPTEPIGSIPRPLRLIEAVPATDGADPALDPLYDEAIRDTIERFETTGSPVITDGEQRKYHNFWTYCVHGMPNTAPDGFKIPFSAGHVRRMPRLTAGPFRYKRYADSYLDVALKYTHRPVKQAVISPSALSLMYPPDEIPGYPREQFIDDLLREHETEVRACLRKGAHKVQIDFTEGRLAIKIDPSGDLLNGFIDLNNMALSRFSAEDRKRIGVHTCPGSDRDSTHSGEVDYAYLLPRLFELKAGNFYVALADEKDRVRVLKIIREHLKPDQRVFVGVINPIDPRVETPEEVRDRVLEAAQYILVEQLGTCDDCGFSPFCDDTTTTRETAFEKIRSRVRGTELAAEILGGG